MKLKKLFFLTTLFVFFCFGQNSKQELDSLYENDVNTLFRQGKLKESLALCEKLIKGYEKINDQKGVVKVYVYAANINSNLFDIKKSLHYLDMALKKNANQNNLNVEAQIYAELGRNYNIIGFTKEAIENLNKSTSIAKRLPIENRNKILKYTYSLRSVIYEELGDFSGLYKDLHLSHNLSPDVYTSSRLGKFFIVHKKNLDSAKYYLELGNNLSKGRKYPIFQISILKRNWGRYYQVIGDYHKAISSYEESLLISKQLNKPQDQKETYKLLYEVYKHLGDDKKSTLYLEKYTHLSDSIIHTNKRLHEIPLKNILKEKQVNIEKKSSRKIYLIILIFVLLAIFAWIAYCKRVKVLHEEKEKSRIETDALKLKINDSFEELVKLAKENAPEFYAKFKETYPKVIVKILGINPNLRVSELTLCAYIFLGFNAKDIARYTHKSINTIRNRKYNLRKKLNLSEEVDISLWFRDFDNEKND